MASSTQAGNAAAPVDESTGSADPTINFSVAERPKVTRTREAKPNPFLEPVRQFAKDGKEGQSVQFTVTGVVKPSTEKRKHDDGTEYDAKVRDPKIVTIEGQLKKAGQEIGVAVRKVIDYTDDGNAVVSFWTTPKAADKESAQ